MTLKWNDLQVGSTVEYDHGLTYTVRMKDGEDAVLQESYGPYRKYIVPRHSLEGRYSLLPRMINSTVVIRLFDDGTFGIWNALHIGDPDDSDPRSFKETTLEWVHREKST